MFQKDENFRDILHTFSISSSSQEEIAAAGESALLILCGLESDTRLDDARYEAFCKKLPTSSKAVLPENLPPTSDTAKFHSLRVFLKCSVGKVSCFQFLTGVGL